jgi:hypothetical protein
MNLDSNISAFTRRVPIYKNLKYNKHIPWQFTTVFDTSLRCGVYWVKYLNISAYEVAISLEDLICMSNQLTWRSLTYTNHQEITPCRNVFLEKVIFPQPFTAAFRNTSIPISLPPTSSPFAANYVLSRTINKLRTSSTNLTVKAF